MKKIIVLLLMANVAFIQKIVQPTLGNHSAKIIKKGKLTFKYFNKNGKLDKYEDWRLPQGQRINDLISKMTLKEKISFMLISTTRLSCVWSLQPNPPKDVISNGFNEMDLLVNTNIFTRQPLPRTVLMVTSITKAVNEIHQRHFILQVNTSVKIMAEFTSSV